MKHVLRYALPIYYILYLFTAFFWRSYIVWRRTGERTFHLRSSETAHDFVGRLYRLITLASAIVIVLYSLYEPGYQKLVPIPWLQNNTFTLVGCGMLICSLLFILIAQLQMGNSWRIGIDQENETKLVQTGLFRFSRNPIFLGVRLNLLGFLLVLPNAFTLVILVLGDVILQIQVRMEEEFLTQQHGESYEAYKRSVPRWLIL